MIPRFQPRLGIQELISIIKGGNKNSVNRFEKKFAEKFSAKDAIAFPYGRTGLLVFLKALKLENIEIISPSYTCSVVIHAITLSNNKPVLIDINKNDFNMDLEKMEEAITSNTKVIIATHLFGYPMNMQKLIEIKEKAEKKYSHKIWLIDDSAHSFGVTWRNKPVSKYCDLSLYGLNISKLITTIYGGIISFNDKKLANIVRDYWDEIKKEPSIFKLIYRKIYALQCLIIFKPYIYWFIHWLQNRTNFLDKITKAYHLDDKISLPKDSLNKMLPFEAEIGICQLEKYNNIIQERKEIAKIYNDYFKRFPGWIFPRFDKNSNYSHYTILVPNREKIVKKFMKYKIEIGILIQYSIDNLNCYKSLNSYCPNARKASSKSINIPLSRIALKKLNQLKFLERYET